jgi:hypothetical protein
MSLAQSEFTKLQVGQLTVNPNPVGDTEGLLTIGNDNNVRGRPKNEYRMRVLKSDNLLDAGHLYHESITNDNSGNALTRVYLQYDHVQ